MSKIVITSASNAVAQANLQRSVINGVPLMDIEGQPGVATLLPEIRKRAADGRVRVWGSVAGSNNLHRTRWGRIEPGDWIVISAHGRFSLAARIYAVLDSPELADSIWDADSDQGSYRYISFFDSLTNVSVTPSAMNSALGYQPGYIYRGFLVPAEAAQQHLNERFGGVTEFLDALSNELHAGALLASHETAPLSEYLEAIGAIDAPGADDRVESILDEHLKTVPPEVADARIKRVKRDRILVRKLKDLYHGRCQRCEFTFTQRNGAPYAEAAHITRLAEQLPGIDSPENIVILCANCHRMLDHGKLQIYWDKATGRAVAELDDLVEPLRLNEHIHKAWTPATEWQAAAREDSH